MNASSIIEIYQGYLDLTLYLEEKFPGGVHAVYSISPVLLVVAPVTQETINLLIKPACDRFNALKSTQLKVDRYKSGALITTMRATPTIYVLYYLVASYVEAQAFRTQYQPVSEREDRVSQWAPLEVTQHNVIGKNTVMIKGGLDMLISGELSALRRNTCRVAITNYQNKKGDHPEIEPLEVWLFRPYERDN